MADCTALDLCLHNFVDCTVGLVSALLVRVHSAVGCTDTAVGSSTATALRTSPVPASCSPDCMYPALAVLAQLPMNCAGYTSAARATATCHRIALDILHSDPAAHRDCWDHSGPAVPAGAGLSDAGTTSC